jgi:hypothetical protein
VHQRSAHSRWLHLGRSAVLAAALASPAWAQQTPAAAVATDTGRKTVEVVRLAEGERITLDGRLDEGVWTRAMPATDFRQVDPDNGAPATEPTEVRIAISADALYLGVTCFDSEPDRIRAFQRRRDEFLGSDDKFRWSIDTFLDARTGYFFEMNSQGSMADALIGTTGQNRAWDGIWNGRVARTDKGWTLEVEIPFRTVNFDPNGDTWGINFDRTVIRKNETTIWTGWARNQGLQRMTNAGHVTGIRDVTQGLGLDIKPYGVLIAEAFPGRPDLGKQTLDADPNAGLDLFYNPTPGIRANLTINTDFAQTEVDQRQVNLTRFSLFFPERRDFFLDGATFFDFLSGSGQQQNQQQQGGPTDQIIPFFSRRIGLSASGAPQKIDFGTKVTGQLGSQDVGVLHVRTGDDDVSGAPGDDFSVVRIKRRMLRQSFVGVLYTRRDARGDQMDANQTLGLDAQLSTSTFLGSQNLSLSGWFLRAQRPTTSSRNNAFGLVLSYPNDRWDGQLAVREVQRDFSPDVGFVTRQEYRRFNPSLTFGPRPRGHRYIRQFEFGANSDVVTDLENQLLERIVELTLLGVQFHSGDNFDVEIAPTYERLDAPFTISRGITLPMGAEYDFTRFQARVGTTNRRVVSTNVRVESGGFYSGSRRVAAVGVTARLRPGYLVSLNSEFNRVELDEGSFTTRLFRLVGEAQFSPRMALVNNVQYDSQSAVLGWQSRFRWILRPGNDLYLVYTHNWVDDPLRAQFATLDKRIATKVVYTHRF